MATFSKLIKVEPQDKDIALTVTKQFYADLYINTCENATAKKIIKQTIVAGGAIRDTILEREIADIDVFVPSGSIMSKWPCEEDGNILWNMGFRAMINDDYGVGTKVYENRTKYDLPVQIIMHKEPTPSRIISAFPVSISRVYWSPKDNRIWKAPSFNNSVKRKVVFYRSDTNKNYIGKIKEKYGDYKWSEVVV